MDVDLSFENLDVAASIAYERGHPKDINVLVYAVYESVYRQ
jgi:hypothetical protein